MIIEPGWDAIRAKLERRLDVIPHKMGLVALRFIDDNFAREGWRDNGLSSWPMRKDNEGKGRSLLIGKGGGHLRRDIRVVRETRDHVIVGTELPYARIHNQGGTTHPRVSDRMRGWAWAMYKATGKGKYKGIATTKKERLTVKIPKRQFMGVSHTLYAQLKKMIHQVIS